MPLEDPVLTNLRCPECLQSISPQESELIPDHSLYTCRCPYCQTLLWFRKVFHQDTGQTEITFASAARGLAGTGPVSPDAAAANAPNPKKRYGDLKPPLALIPPVALVQESRAFAEGARKYGPYNWRITKVEAMTYAHAILRHTMAYIDGEDVDPETPANTPHLALVRACAAILLDATECGALIDNRPPPGQAAPLIRRLSHLPTEDAAP